MADNLVEVLEQRVLRRQLAPLLLLDIDGVINAVQHPPKPGYLMLDTNGGGTIRYRPDVVQRLAGLHRTGAVDIHWLTSWFRSAHDHLEPALGLPCWPVEGRVDETGTGNIAWWKVGTARRLLAANPDRSLIWVDDDLDYTAEQDELGWLTNPALLISPSPYTGLTHEHLDQIEHFTQERDRP